MIRELAWYIESERFAGIVEELEEKAASYAAALAAGSEDAGERREEFRTLCRWHMKKSGFRADEAETMDTDAEFFDGTEVRRTALDRFEKEVIKAHMYQKHLWEFMGTTGSMTVISKSAMAQDGFNYGAYLPIEHRRNTPQKSPLSSLLKGHSAAVPIYQYLDGSVSTKYDSDRAAARFDVLKDKSGFDWGSEGWNPNYEVEKNGWHGEYGPDGTWTFVHEDEPTAQEALRSTAESSPPFELIRDGDGAILYDPGRSLLSLALRVWLLEDGSVYGAEKTDIRKTAELLRSALGRMGAKNITAVCAGDGKKRSGTRMMAAYRSALGELLSPDAKPKTAAAAEESRRKFHAEAQAEETAAAGRQLFRAVQAAAMSGAKDADVAQSVRNGTVRIPLSLYDESDRTALGLTEADCEQIFSYDVPEEKRAAFSATVLGLLKEERLFATGGISRSDIIGMAYAYAVQGKKPEGTVSVETTLARLCSDPDIDLRCGEAEETTLTQLEEAYKSIPRQADAETQRATDAATASAIRNFTAIRTSTGMTPEEAVEAAVRIIGGKTGKPRAIPRGKIEYVTPGTGGADDGKRRIFADIPLEQLAQEAASQPLRTKEADLQSVMTHGVDEGAAYNLLSAEEREAWYESEQFKESGLSVEQAELLAEEEAEQLRQERKPERAAVISWETELDEQYGLARRQNLDKTASVRIVPPTTRVSAEEAVKQLNRQFAGKDAAKKTGGRTYNLLSEEERKEFYRTEEFKEIGMTEKEADGLIMAYAGQGRTSAAARVFILDALLFRKVVRRARKDKRKVPATSAMPAEYDKEQQKTADAFMAALERAVLGKSEGAAGPFRAWRPLPGGTPAPRPVLAVRAEDAVQARRLLLAGKDTDRTVGQEKNAHNSFSQTQWHPDTAENLFTANDAVLEQAEIPSRRMTEYQNGRKFAHSGRQDAGTGGNSFPGTNRTLEQAEIFPRQLTGHQNTQEHHYSDRRDAVASENSFPIPGSVMEQAEASFPEPAGMRERAGIPLRQPAERQNTQGFPSQDWKVGETHVNPSPQTQQVAETDGNPSPRTRQTAETHGNAAAEKRTGAPEAARDIITEGEQAGQDAEARRMERLNAAYERDRAALAKTDPAFARSTFRDVGHAEGSGETDGHDIRKILAMKKSGLMADLEKDKEKGL